MKNKNKLFIAIFFLIIITKAFSSEKIKIAILDFKSINVDNALANAIVENLTTAIIDTGNLIVVERSQLNKIFNELKLTSNDDFKEDDAIEIGQLSGAKLVFIGSVTKIGKNITINVRGIDVVKGEAQFAKKLTTKKEENLPNVIDELAILINNHFSKEEKKIRYVKKDITKKERINKRPVKIIKQSNNKVPAIVCNVVGGAILLTGVALLGASLGYDYYLENNENNYNNYVQGKSLSQGLFYGSMASLGTATIAITISIPLFVIKKK